jgi:hypothetical protein
MNKPIICVDFDGVIHSYKSGWKGATVISDPVNPGFFEWLDEVSQHFKIVVYSSRSKEAGACDAVALWLADQRKKWRDAGGVSSITDGTPVDVEFAHEKPAAYLTIDDRAICFDGNWPSAETMRNFKPWY